MQVWVDTSDPPLMLVVFFGVAPTFGILYKIWFLLRGSRIGYVHVAAYAL